MWNTKIVATLGPATDPPTILRMMLEAGVDVFRLNASHGTRDDVARRIQAVRQVAKEKGKYPAILLDLQGPKIRLGKFENDGCMLQTGSIFTITVEPALGTCERASTGYAKFAEDVKPGDRVLLADGAVELRALSADAVSARFLVISGGPVGSNKGINLPGVQVSAPSLTEKDLGDLQFGLECGIDMVALSFVRTAADVCHLRERLEDKEIPVIAKIEKPQAWDNIDSILDEVNGVMVARGDLGVEMALERVPPIQKSIIRRARRRAKFVITATQMLESMIEHSTPTRAAVSDVANAISDGTDAVMLAAETAVGKYPVEAVKYMGRIASEAERSMKVRGFPDPPHSHDLPAAQIVADAAYHAARAAGVSAIVVFTSSGSSARLVSHFRPPVCIYAVTPREEVARRLAVNYGVVPVLAPQVASTDEMLEQMDHLMVEGRHLKPGDSVIFVAGQPVGRPGTTNLMKLHRIGELR